MFFMYRLKVQHSSMLVIHKYSTSVRYEIGQFRVDTDLCKLRNEPVTRFYDVLGDMEITVHALHRLSHNYIKQKTKCHFASLI